MRTRRTHWLKENQAIRLPRRILCLDSEALQQTDGREERHTFRLAYCTYDSIDPDTLAASESDEIGTHDPDELWAWIGSKCSRRHRTVLFAHNLAYDLRLCRGFEVLPRFGWELRGFALDRYRCWARWRKGDLSLAMVDTVSFVGRGMAHFADTLGQNRPELPSVLDSTEAWLGRCRSDTHLLRNVVLRLLRFIRDEDCGDFRTSGPAQGFAQYRHRFMPPKTLLVHDDAEQLARERKSAWTGRCEAWRHGTIKETLYEWDYATAYARIAAHTDVPVRYRGPVSGAADVERATSTPGYTILVACRIRDKMPVVPCAHNDHIYWPTGSFRTLLWGPELVLARQSGADVEIESAWLYRTAPALRDWGDYMLAMLDGRNEALCPVARATLRQWSRTVIGRFGLRYPVWEQCGELDDYDCGLIRRISADTGETGAWLRIGRQIFDHSGMEESFDSAPAIMAYIMAISRCNLWRAMLSADLAHVVYVDTDAIIATEEGSRRLSRFAKTAHGDGLRLKATHAGGVFYGPRQIILGRQTRIAGLPKNAQPIGPKAWNATFWEGASHSMARKRPSEIVLTQRTVRLRGRDTRRRHLPGGLTKAYIAR